MKLNQTPTRAILESVVLAILLTGLSYLVGATLGWLPHGVNWIEFFAVLTSYSCTYLCVMQRRINYPIGAVSTALYTVLFLQAGLYSSMLLNLWLTPWLVYGWIRWRSDAHARPVTWVKPAWWPLYGGIAAVAYIVAAYFSGLLGGQMAFWDAFILVGTILAQTLMDNKKIENWIVWLAVDVVAVYVYFTQGLPIAGFQYVFFLGNTVWGFLEWRKEQLRHQKSVEKRVRFALLYGAGAEKIAEIRKS